VTLLGVPQERLKGYEQQIQERLAQQKLEAEYQSGLYHPTKNHKANITSLQQSITTLESISDYKDSKKLIADYETQLLEEKHLNVKEWLAMGNFDFAVTCFSDLGNYKDSQKRYLEVSHIAWGAMVTAKRYGEAREVILKFKDLGDYSDSEQRAQYIQDAIDKAVAEDAKEEKQKNIIVICSLIVIVALALIIGLAVGLSGK
jgi:hypothetical protein